MAQLCKEGAIVLYSRGSISDEGVFFSFVIFLYFLKATSWLFLACVSEIGIRRIYVGIG